MTTTGGSNVFVALRDVVELELNDLRYRGARRADLEALEARLGGEDLAGLARVI